MKIRTIEHKTKSIWAWGLACLLLLALLLVACSSSASTSLPVESPPEPAALPPAGSHPPVILRVEQREEISNGFLWIYQDIYYADADGDATAMTYAMATSSLTYPLNFTDDPLESSAEEQKSEAFFTVTGRCWQKLELVFESRVRDAAGNLSEPVPFQMICTTPPAVDIKPVLVSGLLTALPIALLLGLGFWFLFCKRPEERLPVLRSTLLLFCLFLLFRLVQLVLHEGGHSLYQVFRGIPFTLYVHPFILSGYSRPVIDNSIWKDILGSLISLPLSLLISVPFWKRRSTALLPLVMLFPYAAVFSDGINVLGIDGDFRNLVQTSGLSPIPFFILGALIILVGLALLFALFPLLGLDHRDKRALFVLPAALFLQSALSFLVALLFVPGSPIDQQYFLGQEIMAGANSFLLSAVTGVILALLYITLYRKLQPRLPAWLQTKKVEPTWKDLRLPALLATASLVIGLIVVI
jgi:hypothetical protein